jgi:nitroimidazol reductase NimA-like FMN-containing flavoprotein (pyridoxamine 5'-phosphate oxidase superfamily)
MPDPIAQTWETAAAVLDAAPFCHVAFLEGGLPRVLPAVHARVGTTLYLHGSPASTVVRAAASGASLSISVVVLDGVVVAHSACRSGLNYRSVLLSGTGREVEDPGEIERALRAITERVTPGGWQRGRLPRPEEIATTAVAAVAVTEFSVRARTGPSKEDEADRALAGWSGVVPLRLQAGPALADPHVAAGAARPPIFGESLPSA